MPEGWLPPEGWSPPSHLPAAPPGWAWVTDDSPQPPPVKAPEPPSRAKVILGILVISLGFIWVAGSLFQAHQSDLARQANTQEDSRIEAWGACQQEIDQYLKSPASAGYPMTYELDVKVTGDTYFFPKAWVDSQNSFGAQVRTYVTCTANRAGSSWAASIQVLG